MKAVINGKRYDTDKAELLGEHESGHPCTDFQYWSAGLYRTKRSKQYFLAGEGGAMSRYGRSYGQNMGFGQRIDPMTAEEALEWAEEYLTAEEVEEAFGDTIEDA